MCLACLDYIKGELQLNELKNNIREMKIDDSDHAEKVQTILYDHDGDEKALKSKLQKLNSN